MTQTSILITGCTHGLGRELALRFARDNLKVYAVGRNEKLIIALSNDFKNIVPIVADVAKDNGRVAIYESLKNENLSYIIHNAAIATPSMIDTFSEALLKEHFETNFFAPVLLNKMFLSILKKDSRVLHITSLASELSIPGLMPYCISKGALEHMTKCFNAEFNSKGIYFANLRPGMIDTEMQENLRNSNQSDLPCKQMYLNAKSENKLRKPEDVAEFVKWVLCNTENSDFSLKLWDINDLDIHSIPITS
jgi:benzil reductase ((S)-benzoin forming)